MRKLTQSYNHGASEVPLIGQTIGNFFDHAVERWGDGQALIVRHQNIRWTYDELKSQVDAFATGLVSLGLEPGQRIGIWSQNNAEWAITQFATAKAGLILVNINPAYRLSELEYALNKVQCAALVISPNFKTSDYVQMVCELAPEIQNNSPGQLNAEKLPHLRTVIRMGEETTPGMYNFAQIAEMGGDQERQKLLALSRE